MITLSALLVSGCAGFSLPWASDPQDATAIEAGAEAPPLAAAVERPAEDSVPIASPSRDLMRQVQTALNERGLDAGPADGLTGPRTTLAIRLFKIARQLEVTNDITPALLDELGIARPS